MFKVVMIALLLNLSTGTIDQAIVPIPAFETMEQCEEFKKVQETKEVPQGFKQYLKCIDPFSELKYKVAI